METVSIMSKDLEPLWLASVRVKHIVLIFSNQIVIMARLFKGGLALTQAEILTNEWVDYFGFALLGFFGMFQY